MKKIILLLCAFLLIIPSAHASDPFADRDALQGSTLEFRIPKYETQDLSATFDGKNVPFFQITATPKHDEPISRGEFLELLFLNHQFPETDTVEAPNFPDVPVSNPFHQSITKAAQLNIIHGYQEGNFGPYDTITRGQIAKILVNAFDPPAILSQPTLFSDVPADSVFYNHIQKSIMAGIFQGYPDGLMRPDRPINFLEADIVIKRVLSQEELTPLPPRDYFRGFLGIHRLDDPGQHNLTLNLDNNSKNLSITTIKRDFPTHSFNLSASKTQLFGQDAIDTTWAQIDAAKSNPHPEQLWEGTFQIPTNGELTLGFGDKLYINGSYAGSHFGHDWANVEGTEIHASNHGIITLADWTPSYGNTIVIDHGHNIFSMYLHLSELKTTAGQTIKKGDLIGLMGDTGIATGSHLHFTNFIGNIIVDSEEWLHNEF